MRRPEESLRTGVLLAFSSIIGVTNEEKKERRTIACCWIQIDEASNERNRYAATQHSVEE
jgi:hypothetical protein